MTWAKIESEPSRCSFLCLFKTQSLRISLSPSVLNFHSDNPAIDLMCSHSKLSKRGANIWLLMTIRVFFFFFFWCLLCILFSNFSLFALHSLQLLLVELDWTYNFHICSHLFSVYSLILISRSFLFQKVL